MAANTANERKIGGIGSDAVRRATGRGWDEWLDLLDQCEAGELDHRGIVALLVAQAPRLDPWWRQMITVGYEQARGKRERHQKASGFAAHASKTIGAPLAVLFTAWSDPRLRVRWLGASAFTIRKATPGKSMRITWADASNVDVNFFDGGASKSQVQVEHDKLPSAAAVAKAKAFWKARLERLARLVEGGRSPGNPKAATGPARARTITRTKPRRASAGSAGAVKKRAVRARTANSKRGTGGSGRAKKR